MHDILWKQTFIYQIPFLCNKTNLATGYVFHLCLLRRVCRVVFSCCLSLITHMLELWGPCTEITQVWDFWTVQWGLVNLSQELSKETGPVFTYWYGKGNVANVNNWWIWDDQEFLVYCYIISWNLKLYKKLIYKIFKIHK